jgi:nuclear transport factor 2 (NTF2) superfamily protein
MQITAKLIQLLPLQTGTGKNGIWKKQEIIVETTDQYAKKICISIWGDKADSSILQVGNQLKIDFDVESREYNGKWYTDVKAWKVEFAGGSNIASDSSVINEEPTAESSDEMNDLPF